MDKGNVKMIWHVSGEIGWKSPTFDLTSLDQHILAQTEPKYRETLSGDLNWYCFSWFTTQIDKEIRLNYKLRNNVSKK